MLVPALKDGEPSNLLDLVTDPLCLVAWFMLATALFACKLGPRAKLEVKAHFKHFGFQRFGVMH